VSLLQPRIKSIAGQPKTNYRQKSNSLVAISPQTPDYGKELKGNHNLDFEVLTDKNSTLAKQLGISFKLQDYVVPVYENLGIELSEYNGNDNIELPVPAVFLIDINGSITYKFIDSNYMNRINIQELIKQL
jgi:peroxiredoxin